MTEAPGMMELFFGKKKKVTRKRPSKSGKIVKPKGLTAAVSKKARRFKVKTRLMRAGKHIGYRKLSHIKKDIKRKEKAMKARKAGKKAPVRRRKRAPRSSFGVGGSYMPLSSFSSPYPYAVDSSPPWI